MSIDIDLIDRLDNLIFPVGKGTYDKEGNCIGFKLYGTSFLIGHNNFALTASHVIDAIQADIVTPETETIAGIFKDKNNLKYACGIFSEDSKLAYENHPDHDVSIFKLTINKEVKIRSPFIIEKNFRLPGADFYSVGYPEHLMFDNHLRVKAPDGTSIPDEINILMKGYVKRLLNYPIGNLKGSKFLELSEVGTAGYSGAPVVSQYATTLALAKDNKVQKQISCHRLLGIYIGEKATELGDTHKIHYGYATSVEAFMDWKPKILNGQNISQAMMILMEM